MEAEEVGGGGTGDVRALPMLTAPPPFFPVPVPPVPPAPVGLDTGGGGGAGLDASNDAMSRLRSSSRGVCRAVVAGGGGAPMAAELLPTKCSMARCTSYEVASRAVRACVWVKPIPSTSRSFSMRSDADGSLGSADPMPIPTLIPPAALIPPTPADRPAAAPAAAARALALALAASWALACSAAACAAAAARSRSSRSLRCCSCCCW